MYCHPHNALSAIAPLSITPNTHVSSWFPYFGRVRLAALGFICHANIPQAVSIQPSIIHHARATSSSEAASLHGYDRRSRIPFPLTHNQLIKLTIRRTPAKTPIIAASICGGVLFIAWIIGFTIYFRKRYNRKKRKLAAIAAGMAPPEVKARPETEKVVIPPDPAVLLGQRRPGYAFGDANSTHGTVSAENNGSEERRNVHPIGGNSSGVGSSGSGGKHERVEEQRPLLPMTTDMPDISALNQYPPTGRRGTS